MASITISNTVMPASPTPKVATLAVEDVGWREVDGKAWDEFAERCEASYRCAYGYIVAWRLDSRVRLLNISRRDGGVKLKIGQCAIAWGRGCWTFLDRLQLLPEYGNYWRPAMAALLQAIGPGRYCYGSTWNIEPRREDDLAAIWGVDLVEVTVATIEAVDFSRWSCWEDYHGALSSNIRRNAARAYKTDPDISISTTVGRRTVFHIPMLAWLRGSVFQRKNQRFGLVSAAARAFSRAVFLSTSMRLASVRLHRRIVAMFVGIDFGPNTYYVEGGSRADNEGAAWYLITAMLKRAFHRSSSGKFVMGCVLNDPGLECSRNQCRVTSYPSSIVEFDYVETGP